MCISYRTDTGFTALSFGLKFRLFIRNQNGFLEMRSGRLRSGLSSSLRGTPFFEISKIRAIKTARTGTTKTKPALIIFKDKYPKGSLMSYHPLVLTFDLFCFDPESASLGITVKNLVFLFNSWIFFYYKSWERCKIKVLLIFRYDASAAFC